MEEIKSKVIEILNKLRPFLVMDGGDVEFLKYEDGIVYVRMIGACAGCLMLDSTLKDGIEAAIMAEIPEVKGVINID